MQILILFFASLSYKNNGDDSPSNTGKKIKTGQKEKEQKQLSNKKSHLQVPPNSQMNAGLQSRTKINLSNGSSMQICPDLQSNFNEEGKHKRAIFQLNKILKKYGLNLDHSNFMNNIEVLSVVNPEKDNLVWDYLYELAASEIDYVGKSGENIVQFSIMRGEYEFAIKLLKKGLQENKVDINHQDRYGSTILFDLLNSECDIMRVNRNHNSYAELKQVILNCKNLDPNKKHVRGFTALTTTSPGYCFSTLSLEDLKILVDERGADINHSVVGVRGLPRTILNLCNGSFDKIHYIMEYSNFDISKHDIDSLILTLYDYNANHHNDVKLLKCLFTKGTKITYGKEHNEASLFFIHAYCKDAISICELFIKQAERQEIDKKNFINEKIKYSSSNTILPATAGKTVLYKYVKNYDSFFKVNNKKFIKFLLDTGADPDITVPGDEGKSARIVAEKKALKELFDNYPKKL